MWNPGSSKGTMLRSNDKVRCCAGPLRGLCASTCVLTPWAYDLITVKAVTVTRHDENLQNVTKSFKSLECGVVLPLVNDIKCALASYCVCGPIAAPAFTFYPVWKALLAIARSIPIAVVFPMSWYVLDVVKLQLQRYSNPVFPSCGSGWIGCVSKRVEVMEACHVDWPAYGNLI
jgi:hypothetical protein